MTKTCRPVLRHTPCPAATPCGLAPPTPRMSPSKVRRLRPRHLRVRPPRPSPYGARRVFTTLPSRRRGTGHPQRLKVAGKRPTPVPASPTQKDTRPSPVRETHLKGHRQRTTTSGQPAFLRGAQPEIRQLDLAARVSMRGMPTRTRHRTLLQPPRTALPHPALPGTFPERPASQRGLTSTTNAPQRLMGRCATVTSSRRSAKRMFSGLLGRGRGA